MLRFDRVRKVVPAGENGRVFALDAEDPFLRGLNDPRYVLFPGFCDVHVHFREPGFSYKETIRTGTAAAARGGYTTVCPMPNLDPVPDSAAHLEEELALIRRDALVETIPYGAITIGEAGETLSDMDAMAEHVCAFSDDGRGVQSEERMRGAMRKAKGLGKMIVAHCEVNEMLRGGYIHDGAYARAHGHAGICSESEWRQVERDIRLSGETGCAYHVCHVSTKESVRLIRDARARGLNVSCETAPHYLTLDENDLLDEGRFRMNPPLRTAEDREALIEGVLDGTVCCVATDHAPHSAEEKSGGLAGSAFGIVGLETAFPVLYTRLVRERILPLEKLVALLTTRPRERFGLPRDRGFSVWDLGEKYTVDPGEFLSKGRSTPFEGMRVYGRCLLTAFDGMPVWRADAPERTR